MTDSDPVEELDPTKTDEETKAEADSEQAAGATDDAKSVADDKPKPGTPDKHIQRLQQDLSAVTRQLAALTEKKEQQGALSEADKAKLAKAQERIARIREFADDPIAEQVLDLNDRIGEQDRLKAELDETRARLAAIETHVGWERARTKYGALDVDAIWEKAVKDASDTLAGEATPKAVNRLASRWFEERCDNALKRKKDGDGKPPANNRTADAPATYKVGSGQKTAPVLSEDDAVLAEARALVREI